MFGDTGVVGVSIATKTVFRYMMRELDPQQYVTESKDENARRLVV
jgi:hypothetical protein